MKEIRCSAGSGKYTVGISGFATDGNGLCLFLYGGECPHVGGCVLAVPKETDVKTPDISSLCVPGHRDTDIAMEIAKYIAEVCCETVSISAGIHIDHASKEEIRLLCDNCREAARAFVAEYFSESAGQET